MSTKRALIPFTQNRFLFSVKQQGVKETTKTVAHGETIYSEEIYAPSEHGFASLVLQYVVDALDTTGTLTIKVQYRIPGTSTWTTGVTLATITNPTEGQTYGVAYRLDATLGVNWIPNIPTRISFALSANLSTDEITIRGRYVV